MHTGPNIALKAVFCFFWLQIYVFNLDRLNCILDYELAQKYNTSLLQLIVYDFNLKSGLL